MKRKYRLVDWIKKETWWRKYYKKRTLYDIDARDDWMKKETWCKRTLYDTDAWYGRCNFCDASIDKNDIPRCNDTKGKYCPCKRNECLTVK